jgi:hypothetical protein
MLQGLARAVAALAFLGLPPAFLTPAGAAVAAVAQGENAAETTGAVAMRARYEVIRPQLEQNQFGKPVFLESRDSGNDLNGDVYGIVEHPFDRVSVALADPANWCHVLILPYNTKQCTGEKGQSLTVYVGRKSQEPVERAYRINFTFVPVARTADYLRRVLRSGEGPLGTRNYAIMLEATPLDERRTLIHLSYSYSYGTLSKLAMQAYLATSGSAKVGFSTVEEGGVRRFVGGMRGVIERNTMRYFLAIDAFLNSLSAPPGQQLEKRLNEWYAYSEKYRRQLWEMDRGEYLAMKRAEAQRGARAPS